jgi:hypothetical protein
LIRTNDSKYLFTTTPSKSQPESAYEPEFLNYFEFSLIQERILRQIKNEYQLDKFLYEKKLIRIAMSTCETSFMECLQNFLIFSSSIYQSRYDILIKFLHQINNDSITALEKNEQVIVSFYCYSNKRSTHQNYESIIYKLTAEAYDLNIFVLNQSATNNVNCDAFKIKLVGRAFKERCPSILLHIYKESHYYPIIPCKMYSLYKKRNFKRRDYFSSLNENVDKPKSLEIKDIVVVKSTNRKI